MKVQKITLPDKLDFEQALDFSVALNCVPFAEVYLFNVQWVSTVRPFGMLMTSALLRDFMQRRINAAHEKKPIFKITNYSENVPAHSYAAHVGFFRSWGVPYGYAPGEAWGSSTYKPIKDLSIKNISEKASEEMVHPGEIMEEAAREFATFLGHWQDDDVIETLTYAIREIIRNVFEHSQAERIWLVGQYWPTYDSVEISILDQGVGVYQTLRSNPKLVVENYENALHLAVQPGVSGKLVGKKRRRSLEDDQWANSGYGLYVTSKLCQRGGSFSIASGEKALYLSPSNAKFYDCIFQGTALRMMLRVSTISKLKKSLQLIISEGREIAKNSEFGGNLTASMITSMLSRWVK